MSPRRAFLLGAPALLAGCGFRPVYGPDGERRLASGDVAAELASVRVAPIYDRGGQLLRRHLQRRLEGSRPGTPSRFVLTTSISYEVEVEGLRPDGIPTRLRFIANAPWTLSTDAVPPAVVAQDTIRMMDAFNLADLQFFSSDVARDALERRVVDEVGDRVVLGVALALRRQRPAG